MSPPHTRYRPYPQVDLPDRTWPGRTITRPPRWCSVDLRDGNQALVEPMSIERKLRLFRELVRIGFREIEVAFPSASPTEYDFVRRLIEAGKIPDQVTVSVLTQAREDLIRRTIDSLRGARRAIVHVYNSTSELQRRVVFRQDRAGIRDIAVRGVRLVRELAAAMPETDLRLEYSPESFTGTELDFALEVCEAVLDAWGAAPERPVILNLPATVEMATPNVHADQIEWMGRHLSRRESVVLSVHPHNDRGTAVAAAELAQMAGAERVEGTLLGNGERTGNVDLVTLALNLQTQGIDPGLDLADVPAIARLFEEVNRLPVHPRHPYVGDLVFTAFSGSHQDAIRKGLAAMRESRGDLWEVPYLPIDPADIGRTYDGVIRINSQSGKGGVAHVLEERFGLRLPRALQVDFGRHVKALADRTGEELSPVSILAAFEATYCVAAPALRLVESVPAGESAAGGGVEVDFIVEARGERRSLRGQGNGPIDAFVHALREELDLEVRILDYGEHSLGEGSDASAIAYVEAAVAGCRPVYGAGRHGSIVTASLLAVASAVNRALSAGVSLGGPEPAIVHPVPGGRTQRD
jgi:2-isopropylmalate synthase